MMITTLLAMCATTQDIDFMKQIQPILEKRCYECHAAKKQKHKLRFDSGAAILKGGKDGPILVPGKPDESKIIKRISLPKDDDDIMPPEGDPLTKAQIELIKKWVAAGAKMPAGMHKVTRNLIP